MKIALLVFETGKLGGAVLLKGSIADYGTRLFPTTTVAAVFPKQIAEFVTELLADLSTDPGTVLPGSALAYARNARLGARNCRSQPGRLAI